MSDEYGDDLITIVDDSGEEFTLEVLDTMEYKGKTYGAFLPYGVSEDDPDFGMMILEITEDENGETFFDDIESEAELNDVYEHFMIILYGDEE